MAVSARRMESLVESGWVVNMVLFLYFFKLGTEGNKEHNTDFLAAESHKLCQQVKQM